MTIIYWRYKGMRPSEVLSKIIDNEWLLGEMDRVQESGKHEFSVSELSTLIWQSFKSIKVKKEALRDLEKTLDKSDVSRTMIPLFKALDEAEAAIKGNKSNVCLLFDILDDGCTEEDDEDSIKTYVRAAKDIDTFRKVVSKYTEVSGSLRCVDLTTSDVLYDIFVNEDGQVIGILSDELDALEIVNTSIDWSIIFNVGDTIKFTDNKDDTFVVCDASNRAGKNRLYVIDERHVDKDVSLEKQINTAMYEVNNSECSFDLGLFALYMFDEKVTSFVKE